MALECTTGGQGVALQKKTCTDGANNCVIILPLEGSKADQKAYMCMKTSTLSSLGYTGTAKKAQTCQKVSVNNVDGIICACSDENCNADNTPSETFASGTFSFTFMYYLIY